MKKPRENLVVEVDLEGEGPVNVSLEAIRKGGIILLPPSPIFRTSDRVYVVTEGSSLRGEEGTVVEVMTRLGIRLVRVRLDSKRGVYYFREGEVKKVDREKAEERR